MLTVNFSPFPTLHTERLVLREISHKDDEDVFLLRSNRGLMEYIDRPRAETIDDAKILVQRMMDIVAANEGISWAITLKGSDRLIGTIGFWRLVKEHYRGEVGYMLHADYHRQGIMKEAILTAADYAFKTIKLHTIEANINPENIPSIKLAESVDFVREAYFKENYYYNGKFLDSAIYTLFNPYEIVT